MKNCFFSFFLFFSYESLGKQFSKNKPTHPPGMSAEFIAAHKAKVEAETKKIIPGLVIVDEPKKKKKKNKTKTIDTLTNNLSATKISEPIVVESKKNQQVKYQSQKSQQQNKKTTKIQPAPSSRQDGESLLSDSMKRLKNLRKKLREIETLDNKIKSGDIKNPEKEMLDKVARKKEVQNEIEILESNQ